MTSGLFVWERLVSQRVSLLKGKVELLVDIRSKIEEIAQNCSLNAKTVKKIVEKAHLNHQSQKLSKKSSLTVLKSDNIIFRLIMFDRVRLCAFCYKQRYGGILT